MAEKETIKDEVNQPSDEMEETSQEVMESSTEENVSEDIDSELVLEEEESKEDNSSDDKATKSFFKKDKKEKKDKKDIQIEELNDRLIRTLAEFDNFRKRSEREKAQMFEIGAKDIIEKILPTIDNFERGLDTISEEEKEGAFVQGIEKIYKQFVSNLQEAGVKTIDAVGKEFDPNLHNAVMHAEDENYGENTISDEFQKGYLYRDTVIRHSMVKVVN